MTRRSRHLSLLRGALAGAIVVTLVATTGQGQAYHRPGLTTLISHGYDSTPSVNAIDDPIGLSSWESAMSANGRFIAYSSAASNLVPGDINRAYDVFVYDRLTDTNELVSVSSSGAHTLPCSLTNASGSGAPSISADGRFVAFSSCATNLVPGDTNNAYDVFLRDRVAKTTVLVSTTWKGTQASGGSGGPSISPDGKYVAYSSSATDIVPRDINGSADVFLWNRFSHHVEMVSLSSHQGQGSRGGGNASVSNDGRFVAFSSYSPDLVDGDTNNAIDVFVRDVRKRKTERVSVGTGGAQGNSAAGFIASGGRGISADGRYVMISSTSTNFVPNDTNGHFDIFVWDRTTKRAERVTIGSTGAQADGDSSPGAISLNGRYVVVSSSANSFDSGDQGMNGSNTTVVGPQPGDEDVFIYDRKFMTMEMVSVASNQTQATGVCKGAALDPVHQALSLNAGESFGPALSGDGGYIAFESCSGNLTPGDNNQTDDEFLRYRGPDIGVEKVTATSGGTVTLSGSATFSGAVLALATDKTGDAGDPTLATGADITSAQLLYRPEQGDLLARIDVTAMMHAAVNLTGIAAPGDPRVLYGMRFVINGVTYELRINRVGADVGNPLDAAYGLFTCTEQVCTEAANLVGGYGTYGDGVVASIPLSAISPGGKPFTEGAVISSPRAFTGVGSYYGGMTQLLDQLTLTSKASVTVPRKSVTVTVGNTTKPATLTDGKFSVGFPRSLFGAHTPVTVKVCLGAECHSYSTSVAV